MDGENRDERRTLSRREFLKIAGVAGATVTVAGGLGGLLAACGEEETTTSTAGEATTTSAAGETTTTAGGETTTTVSAEAEMGREVKLGFVVPLTGAYSLAAVPARYVVKRWEEFIADGVVLGDGIKHPIKIEVADSQSTSSRASEVAAGLINDAQVDMMMGAAGPDNVIPVADQAEAFGVPCVTNDAPWEAYWNSRGAPEGGFKWTYHWHFGQRDTQRVYFDIWSQFPNNKTYGALWPNDADGNAYRKSWPAAIEKNGWKLLRPGCFRTRTRRFWGCHQHLQERRCRHRGRRGDCSGLHQFLQAVSAAGLLSEADHHRQVLPGSPDHRVTRRYRAVPDNGRLLASEVPIQVLPHRRDLPGARRCLRGGYGRAVAAAAVPLFRVRGGPARA